MAYFNHAFRKTFLATGADLTNYDVSLLGGSTLSVDTDGGFVTTAGMPTYGLNQLAQTATSDYETGYIGYFDPKTNLSILPDNCCNVYVAGSAIYSSDKIGKFHGGYQETNKSKMINPRYVSRFYSVTPCEPINEVLHVGSTYWTAGGGVLTVDTLVAGTGYANGTYTVEVTGGAGTGAILEIVVTGGTVDSATVINPGKGYAVNDTLTLVGGNNDATVDVATVTTANTDAITGSGGTACCKEFLCGETYSLRLDIKGSPALRYLNHNAYYIASAYTGCCPDGAIAPVAVDSTEVYIKWATDILRSPIVNPFVQIVVQDEAGVLWYAPGTSAAELAALGGDTWDNYVSPGHVDGACAGLIMNGAYVDTKFGDCTFQISDFYEKEPVKLYVSEVDFNGDPCAFDGICVVHECFGTQANGLGETILRDFQLSEAYRQNFLHSDFRIREITQGDQIVRAINRNALYYSYYLQHSVPRHNNPSGTFDSDQYLLQFVSLSALSNFAETTETWLDGCGVCELEQFGCESNCDVPIVFPETPAGTPVL
jgi:hypothetical protein